VDTKDSQIMLVMTTNHLDKVPPVLMRPGRIDTFIHFDTPNAATVHKLVEFYAFDVQSGRSLLAPDIDWVRVGEALAGSIPAVIREVVERSKLGGIRRYPLYLTTEDLVIAAAQMRYHAELSAPSKTVEPTPAEKLGSALLELLKPLKIDPREIVIPVDRIIWT
jgi:transitional endoplasmic reticulum ATPase